MKLIEKHLKTNSPLLESSLFKMILEIEFLGQSNLLKKVTSL